jgi:hypothetical protein
MRRLHRWSYFSWFVQQVLQDEYEIDPSFDMLIPWLGFVQLDPFMRKIQAAIMNTDIEEFKSLLAVRFSLSGCRAQCLCGVLHFALVSCF